MRDDLIVWMDLEMTGLEPDSHRILEMATLATDRVLDIVAEGPELIVHQPDEVLESMNEWSKDHHAASGLTERVRSSDVLEADAERETLAFVAQHCVQGTARLAGNSIHLDRRFLARYMPTLEAYLHPELIDVSTVKELARRWYPSVLRRAPRKGDKHRALDDIRESIAELQYYRTRLFRDSSEP